MISLFRLDDRLIHGQVVIGWGIKLNPDKYVIIDDDIEEWDSLSHIRLLTAIEANFGVQFDLDEIGNMTDVATIVDLLHQKLA